MLNWLIGKEGRAIKYMVYVIVIQSCVCLYLGDKVKDKNVTIIQLKQDIDVKKAALEHPAVIVKPKIIYRTITRTVESKPEVITEYIRDEGSETVPIVPTALTPLEPIRKWAIGPCILRFEGTNRAGVSVSRDLFKRLRIEANAGQGWASGAILWTFGK